MNVERLTPAARAARSSAARSSSLIQKVKRWRRDCPGLGMLLSVLRVHHCAPLAASLGTARVKRDMLMPHAHQVECTFDERLSSGHRLFMRTDPEEEILRILACDKRPETQRAIRRWCRAQTQAIRAHWEACVADLLGPRSESDSAVPDGEAVSIDRLCEAIQAENWRQARRIFDRLRVAPRTPRIRARERPSSPLLRALQAPRTSRARQPARRGRRSRAGPRRRAAPDSSGSDDPPPPSRAADYPFGAERGTWHTLADYAALTGEPPCTLRRRLERGATAHDGVVEVDLGLGRCATKVGPRRGRWVIWVPSRGGDS